MRTLALIIIVFLFGSTPVLAVDKENCLMCHSNRGMSYIDGNNELRLLYISPPIYNNSSHGLLKCTQCHRDVKKIPHTGAEKVNCLVECHVEREGGRSVFSHADVQDHLSQSVHSPIDAEGNPKPYPEDYPTCKTCHQDPLYRPLSFFKTIRPGVSEKIMGRCLVCHDDEEFVKKFYGHFTSRMQKGRSSKDVITLCASCHEDTNFLKRHNQPNVVYAYNETYHGKAVSFGDTLSPDCVDCHAGFDASIHAIYPKDDPRSTVHPQNRFAVCSNIDCHPNADLKLMDFKVHLLASRDLHPAEFYVSLFFVILTLSSFIPIMLAAILDVIRQMFPGSTRPEEKTVPARPTVDGVELGSTEPLIKVQNNRRFFLHLTMNQRWQHLVMMLSFAGLVITGMPMKYPHVGWMETCYELMGGITLAPVLHRVCAVIMALSFLYHFVYIAVTYTVYYFMPLRRAGKVTPMNLIKSIFCLPMVPTFDDLKLVWATNKYRLYLTNIKPAATRFTLKEKFGYLAVFWGVPIIGLSGMILWGEEIFTQIFPGNFLNFCLIAHSDEALLATIVIFLWHLYNTHLKMENFPMGMSWLTGFKKESEIEEEHRGYYLGAMQAEGHIPQHEQHAARPTRLRLALRKIAAAVVLVFLTASTAYLSWIVFYTVFGFHMRSVEHIPEKYNLSPPKLLEEIILDGKGQKNFYRGYRLTREHEIRGHFHNITLQVEPDRRSHCISCHGDFPHGKTAEIRSYLNMHDYFLACETCHAKPLAEGQRYIYRWYDKKSGEPLGSTPAITNNIDALGIKLVPGTGTADTWQRLDSDERIAYAARFLEQVNARTLFEAEKKEGITAIHEHISSESITCIQCHTKKASLIPFETIGYTPDAVNHLYAEDVLSVIKDYSQFYLPTFFDQP